MAPNDDAFWEGMLFVLGRRKARNERADTFLEPVILSLFLLWLCNLLKIDLSKGFF
jgi:hypothetical protein